MFGFFSKKYDSDGYDNHGYNKHGYDRNGWNKNGFNQYTNFKFIESHTTASRVVYVDMYGNEVFDTHLEYDINGYNRDGYDKYGYDKNGKNYKGYDKNTGLDNQGKDINGLNKYGVTDDGFDINGFNTQVYPFFQRNIILLDTNILMADVNYDRLFEFFILYNRPITILESVYDELINIKDNKKRSYSYADSQNDENRKRQAMIGLNRISKLQDYNLLILGNIGIQTTGRTYADPVIIRYLQSATNQSIILISNDLDLKIRSGHFKGSSDSVVVLGKDLIYELYTKKYGLIETDPEAIAAQNRIILACASRYV